MALNVSGFSLFHEQSDLLKSHVETTRVCPSDSRVTLCATSNRSISSHLTSQNTRKISSHFTFGICFVRRSGAIGVVGTNCDGQRKGREMSDSVSDLEPAGGDARRDVYRKV